MSPLVVLLLAIFASVDARLWSIGKQESGDSLLDLVHDVDEYFFKPHPNSVRAVCIFDFRIILLFSEFFFYQDSTFRITYIEVDNRGSSQFNPTVVSGGPGQSSVVLTIPHGIFSSTDNSVKLYGFRIPRNRIF